MDDTPRDLYAELFEGETESRLEGTLQELLANMREATERADFETAARLGTRVAELRERIARATESQ